MLGRISIIIEKAKSRKIPIVVDADGLWHLATNPSLLQGLIGPSDCLVCINNHPVLIRIHPSCHHS